MSFLPKNGDPPRSRRFEVVAFAASAGGLAALSLVLAALPADFSAAIVLVLHIEAHRPSHLAEILGRRTRLQVRQAAQGERIRAGTVHVAPPDHHLLVGPEGMLSLSQTGRVHFVRPSADILLESLATGFGERAIAVILSGSGRDGASGIRAVKKGGGKVIVQDRGTSEYFGMPGAAIKTGDADLILPLDEIAPALLSLTGRGGDA